MNKKLYDLYVKETGLSALYGKYTDLADSEENIFIRLPHSELDELRYNKSNLVRMALLDHIRVIKKTNGTDKELESGLIRDNIWYEFIKLIAGRVMLGDIDLSTLKKETKDEMSDIESWYTNILIPVLADLVRKGVVKYEDYKVEDDTRSRMFNTKKTPEERPYVILIVEKLGTAKKMQLMCEELGWFCTDSKGKPGLSSSEMIEKMLPDDVKERGVFVLKGCDYDKDGWDAGDSFVQQLRDLGIKVEGEKWIESLSRKASKKVICAADFMNRPRELLEASRVELYKNMPVPDDWHKMYAEGNIKTNQYRKLAKKIYKID